jgi:hypothetical protein
MQHRPLSSLAPQPRPLPSQPHPFSDMQWARQWRRDERSVWEWQETKGNQRGPPRTTEHLPPTPAILPSFCKQTHPPGPSRGGMAALEGSTPQPPPSARDFWQGPSEPRSASLSPLIRSAWRPSLSMTLLVMNSSSARTRCSTCWCRCGSTSTWRPSASCGARAQSCAASWTSELGTSSALMRPWRSSNSSGSSSCASACPDCDRSS